MSKGKKAKPGKKGAAKPSKKPARSTTAETTEVELAAAEEAAPEGAEAIEADAVASDESSIDESVTAPSDEPSTAESVEAVAESTEATDAATAAGEAEGSGSDASASVATEAAEASSDDDAPIEPKGPGTPVADLPRPDQKRLVESLVFVSDRAINAQQLGRMLKIKSPLAKELADELMAEYQGRGIELVELSGGYQFRSAPSSAHIVREHIAQPPVRLTRAQLETLALVAYRQPITRPEIDDVRGVDSGSALRVLLERGLLKMLGRKDEPGRPLLYGTTPFFLDFFGMRSLKDLPTLREFTELSDENRALFKSKTGESIEEAEAALLAAEQAAQRDSLAAPSASDEAEPTAEDAQAEDAATESTEAAQAAAPESEREAGREPEGEGELSDRDLEVEAQTFAAGSLQTSPDSASITRDAEDEEQEPPRAPEA